MKHTLRFWIITCPNLSCIFTCENNSHPEQNSKPKHIKWELHHQLEWTPCQGGHFIKFHGVIVDSRYPSREIKKGWTHREKIYLSY